MKKLFLFVLVLSISMPFVLHAQNCGTTNIALNKPVAVSQADEWHGGVEAVDGNFNEGWFAPGDTNHIIVDLGQTYNVCKIKINWTSNGRGKNYLAQVSADSTSWTTIFTRTNNSATVDSFDVSGSGRFVRIYVTSKVNSWSGLEMMELRIYNSTANTKPSVSLTAPANNSSFSFGSNITLTAAASDPGGSVSKVEFYQGVTKIGEALSSPYTMVWSNVQAGTYYLTAKATDNQNADSVSLPVAIVVNATEQWSLLGNTGTLPGANFLGTTDSTRIVFKANNIEQMTILPDGFVGIGTSAKPEPEARLAVNGSIYTTKLKVTQTGWADYVFNKNYQLPTLRELEAYIKKHHHLPGVPAAAEVIGKPVDVGNMQEILLKKIEELTLYVIEQQKQIEELKKKIEAKEKK